MEVAAIWSQNSTPSEQRFLVADGTDRSLSIGIVTKYAGESFEYALQPPYRKVPQFRAFDWAPFDESLVAVGQWSGEVTIIRIDDGAPALPLPTKHQRLCNSICFNKSGFLATGSERVRNIEGLNIWDVNQRISSSTSQASRGGKFLEPYRKFASSEAISEVKFFDSQPETVIAGVKGAGIRIYDLRENTSTPSLQFSNARVFNVVIDGLNEHHFACCGQGKDNVIQVWDRRLGSSSDASLSDVVQQMPAIQYNTVFDAVHGRQAPVISSLRYCKAKTGTLAALAGNGRLKIFETSLNYAPQTSFSGNHRSASTQIPTMSQQRLYTQQTYNLEQPRTDSGVSTSGKGRAVSVDFCNLAGPRGMPCILLLRDNRSIDIQEIPGSPTPFDVSSKSALLTTRSLSKPLQIERDGQSKPLEDHREDLSGAHVPSASINDTEERPNIRVFRKTSTGPTQKATAGPLDLHIVDDVSDVEAKTGVEDSLRRLDLPRQRAKLGYGLEIAENWQCVEGNRQVEALWSWIANAKTISVGQGMVAQGLDLSYLGVSALWKSELNSDQTLKRLVRSYADADMNASITTLAKSLELPDIHSVDTAYLEHRQLCLYTCDLGNPRQDVEETINDLVRQGQTTKAAAFAIIQNQPGLAFGALKGRDPSPLHKQLSLALAGYLNGSTDDTWLESVQDIAIGLEDPYARAIVALVSHGDWRDVLLETSLPLGERVGIALMHLDDDDLRKYIKTCTAQAVDNGDLEGIVMTGLTEEVVSLFENYLHRTFDLQSGVLALAFGSPRYFKDPRVQVWRETYRSYLDSWHMFMERASFDIESVHLSTPPDGRPALRPVQGQISLRCLYCDQNLDRNPSKSMQPNGTSGFGIHPERILGQAKSGTVCPKCGRHMPRCVVCKQWVGVPDPHTKGSRQQKMSVEEALDRMTTVCRSCWHVSHSGHAQMWFSKHDVCPAPQCGCRCVRVGGV